MSALEGLVPLPELTHIVITQLDPKSIPCLDLLLTRMAAAKAAPPQVILSNPAMRLLQAVMGAGEGGGILPNPAMRLLQAGLGAGRGGAHAPAEAVLGA